VCGVTSSPVLCLVAIATTLVSSWIAVAIVAALEGARVAGGIEAFTRAAALDLAPYSIRVNAIAPGSILTTPVSEQDPTIEKEQRGA
jgi:NAD(P)-dependent dehydrogenase (short-subunit alcohol dehydrogenase family)